MIKDYEKNGKVYQGVLETSCDNCAFYKNPQDCWDAPFCFDSWDSTRHFIWVEKKEGKNAADIH